MFFINFGKGKKIDVQMINKQGRKSESIKYL